MPEGPDPLELYDAAYDSLGDEGGEWYARHAGMVQIESGWLPRAESPWAQGWAQFTPPTRGDIWPKIAGCALADPFDTWCAILAMHAYMRSLMLRALQMVPDERGALAMARRAYNGGLGWQQREYKLCLATSGCDPGNPRHMQALCREAGRSEAACRENHSYAAKVERAEAGYRERKKKRGLRVLGRIAKTAAKTAVAISPSPVGLDDVQRVRRSIRDVRAPGGR